MIRSIEQNRLNSPPFPQNGKRSRRQGMPLVGVAMLLCAIVSGHGGANAEPSAGALVGRVLYRGPSIPDRLIPVTRDIEQCGTTATIPLVSTQPHTGGLEGAVVGIDGPVSPVTDPPALPLVIENRRCAFSPAVSIGYVGQSLELRNDDPVMHNTHLKKDGRTFLNVALVPNGKPVRKRFAQPGVYTVACDAHKFMTGHALVFSHPYASITDATGGFRIPHLPPGTYTVSIWHSTLGTLRRAIEIPQRGDATLTVEYPAESEAHGK